MKCDLLLDHLKTNATALKKTTAKKKKFAFRRIVLYMPNILEIHEEHKKKLR